MFPMMPPPDNAKILFNGRDVENWTTREGQPAEWKVANGDLHATPGKGDIMTKERFTDFYLHIEFNCPDMPEATGQAKGNSGVFLQGRYEVQVLDSFGWEKPGKGDTGGVYDQFAALVNACKPALHWQTYDIAFRAPRFENGEMVSNTRLTVFQNGKIVQNNIELPGVTGAPLDLKVEEPGPLLVQDHGDLVRFRNIWVVELPLVGSDEYAPA
jgi:hypothetical protein